MLFSELLEVEGIEGVVNKTNISSMNLKYLLDEDFEALNRVRALGFLLILEREYKDIDVSQLRETIKIYYEENMPEDDRVVMVAEDSVQGGGFSFFKFFIIVGLIGGGYYLYTQGKLDSIIKNIEEKKDFFDDDKALENNVSSENAKKVVVEDSKEDLKGDSKGDSVHIETAIAPKSEVISLKDAEEGKEVHKSIESKVDEIQSALSSDTTTKSVEAVVKEVSQEFLNNEANTSMHETEVHRDVTPVTEAITTVSISPTRGMLWYGFINLETKTRREFMKKVTTPFEINNGKWLLVTGHGYLDVVSASKTLEIADNKKHYFYIDSSDIREIDQAEFRELNGNRGW